MSNNAPDYENNLVFPPSMPRCDIEELKKEIDDLIDTNLTQAGWMAKLEEKLNSIECILTSETIDPKTRINKAIAKIKE